MSWRSELLAVALITASPTLACVQPECANPDYTQAECRVVAENELARLLTSSALEIRFQHPQAKNAQTWDARGVVEEVAPGVIRARVAAPGEFAISLQPGPDTPPTLEIRLTNVDPRATVSVGPLDGLIEQAPPAQPSTSRTLPSVDVPQGQTTWIRGRIDCPEAFRILALGDVQTNPVQMERIVERWRQELEDAEDSGEPLLGAVLLGDLTERSRESEFEIVSNVLARSPVPVAVTAGNHDVFVEDRALYNRTFGPGNHTFRMCGMHLALIDTGNASIARSIEGRLPELFDPGNADVIIAGMHYPPHAGFTGSGWGREDQAQHLMMELARKGADLILSGHVHALQDFPDLSIGGHEIREIMVGTAGADQGAGTPRYGYLRMVIEGEEIDTCFVEVPPPGSDGPLHSGLSGALPYCDDGE